MPGVHASETRAPAPGTVLCGKYRVERELGSGGMGTVVVARHLKLDSLVAIKLLPASTPSDPYLAARFLREARAMARLGSEHVVRVLDLDETPDGGPVLVMELLDGEDLERALGAGPFVPGRAVDLVLQACAALAEAHARGIVHRDVKPANLFVVRRLDGREQLKLLDFGISKVSGEDLRLTHTAMGLGSPLFMSPEQLLAPSQVDRRTDVWSLGVTLYRLLSGQAPYPAKDLTSLAAQIAAQPPTPLLVVAPGLDPALAAVVMRCLEKDVAARWPSVLALAEALEPFCAPGGLGSVVAVQQAEAFGVAAAASALPASSAEEPAGRRAVSARSTGISPPLVAPEPVGGRTLSHDVPRVEASPGVVGSPFHLERRASPRAALSSSVPGAPGPVTVQRSQADGLERLTAPERGEDHLPTGLHRPAGRPVAVAVAAGLLLFVGAAVVLWPGASPPEALVPPVLPSSGAPSTSPSTGGPQPPSATPAPTPTAAPTPAVVRPGPTGVAAASAAPPARGLEPAGRRLTDDAGAARAGKADAPRDPADLEIKE